MDLKSLLWYGVLTSITAAYLVAMAVVRSAQQHEVSHYARHMIVACAIVWIRLVAYVVKQILFGHEQFGGPGRNYGSLYAPSFSVHCSIISDQASGYFPQTI
jgi:uncharacterized membrane protein YozB (DUF420 family)